MRKMLFLLFLTTVLHAGGNCEVAKIIGATVQQGTYRFQVKKIGDNAYEVVNKNIIIKTRYCYEYASWNTDVLLDVDSPYGYTIGTLYFK